MRGDMRGHAVVVIIMTSPPPKMIAVTRVEKSAVRAYAKLGSVPREVCAVRCTFRAPRPGAREATTLYEASLGLPR